MAAPKLKVKTTQAIVDHITQTLPSRDGDYVEPLFKEYIKALGGLLSHQNLVELLAAADGDSWFACVRFALECIAKQSGGVKDSSSASRASPAPGSGQSTSFGHSAGRPGTNLVLLSTGTVEKATLTDLLQVVLSLMTPPNAPVLGVSGDVASNVVQVLQQRHLGIGQVHQVAFAILNRILSTVSANDTSLALDFSRDLIPLLRFWWQARSVKDDAMLNSVRSEILKAMFIIHPHVAALTRWSPENPVLQDVEDLLDLLWNEYSNRDAKTKLQLDDLTFATDELPELSFRMRLFGLRPFDMDAERKWAMIQAIALFETVVWTKGTLSAPVAEVDEEDHPRKKRRANKSTRLSPKLHCADKEAQISCLQVLPFFMSTSGVSPEGLSDMLSDFIGLIGDKDGRTASWAMIACARYVSLADAISGPILNSFSSCFAKGSKSEDLAPLWKQIWQIAARSVSLPFTSRAACVLLSAMLDQALVRYDSISDEINSIVTTADINGPASLTDASLALMLRLVQLRNMELPNASQATSQQVVRWLFLRWNPGRYALLLAVRPGLRQCSYEICHRRSGLSHISIQLCKASGNCQPATGLLRSQAIGNLVVRACTGRDAE